MNPEKLHKNNMLARLIRERDEYPEGSPVFRRFDAIIKEIVDGVYDCRRSNIRHDYLGTSFSVGG